MANVSSEGVGLTLRGSVEGVGLTLRGSVGPIRAELDPPVKRVHDQLIEKGGRLLVYPSALETAATTRAKLVEAAELRARPR